jgi:1-phosphatidylinositol-3-phosphate 5-kinase
MSLRKALPRLPSVDDAYEYSHEHGHGSENNNGVGGEDTTPRGAIVALPPAGAESTFNPGTSMDSDSSSHTGNVGDQDSVYHEEGQDQDSSPIQAIITSSPSSSILEAEVQPPTNTETNADPPATRLSALRQTFHRTEQTLYAQLAQTPSGSLNDARRAFLYAAMGARKRLGAWQRKHVSGSGGSGTRVGRGGGVTGAGAGGMGTGELGVEEPEWWGKKCHVLPGGNIIVREDDWGSIIAFTLR